MRVSNLSNTPFYLEVQNEEGQKQKIQIPRRGIYELPPSYFIPEADKQRYASFLNLVDEDGFHKPLLEVTESQERQVESPSLPLKTNLSNQPLPDKD